MPSPNAPELLKAGLVLLDPYSGAVKRVIALQYNPHTLSRTLAPQSVQGQGQDRSEALRLTGPPVETISLEAEIDATDALEYPDNNRVARELGIHPQLAVLESIIYPTTKQLQENIRLAQAGAFEIAPIEAPLTVFVWSKARVAPVRITEFSISEEFFDPNLNPIRATVRLGMRVLNVNDLPIGHKGATIYIAYQREKERLAKLAVDRAITTLGIEEVPT